MKGAGDLGGAGSEGRGVGITRGAGGWTPAQLLRGALSHFGGVRRLEEVDGPGAPVEGWAAGGQPCEGQTQLGSELGSMQVRTQENRGVLGPVGQRDRRLRPSRTWGRGERV